VWGRAPSPVQAEQCSAVAAVDSANAEGTRGPPDAQSKKALALFKKSREPFIADEAGCYGIHERKWDQ
jgi:hypothetical protein